MTALLTVHNRRELTLRCLASLEAQRAHDATLDVVVCDDGSTDGTAAAVAERHPAVTVVRGDGTLFYGGGMRLAWSAARERAPHHYWLLNDDTQLDDGALQRMLTTHDELAAERHTPIVVVGTTRDPAGGTSYGGVVRRPVRRLRFDLLEPAGLPRPADTMNGNCVLVPASVVRRIGIIDAAFRHSMGDYDYGLRARAAGCEIWVAPGYVGVCAPNPGFVPGDGLRADWQRLRSLRHLPPREWREFARRWGGPAWPLLWASPYGRRLAKIVWR